MSASGSASPRKRKLSETKATSNDCVDTESPRKKAKLDPSDSAKVSSQPTNNPFEIRIADEAMIRRFGSHAINNAKPEQSGNPLSSMKVNAGTDCDWRFAFYQMPSDEASDVYSFLDGLFGDKLCDWKVRQVA